MRVKIPLVGPSYSSRSPVLSAQVTRNLYPEISQETREVTAFHGTPGSILRAQTNGLFNRGAGFHAGKIYTVAGDELWQIDRAWNSKKLGSIGGIGQCVLSSDGNYLVICTEGVPYVWDGNKLFTHPSVNVGTPSAFAYLNSRFWLPAKDGGILLTDLNNPLSIANTQDAPDATAETLPDGLLRIYPFRQRQYLFGAESIEQWWNTGSGTPPIARVQGAIIPTGLGALHSVNSNEQAIYFLDHKCRPQRLVGLQLQPIGNDALGDTWGEYGTLTDAIGCCYSWGHKNYYKLSFPGAKKTWVFDETSSSWFEMTTGCEEGRHLINAYQWFDENHVIIDYRNSNVLTWDFNTYADNNEEIVSKRDTAVVHGGAFGARYSGRKITMNSFELIMESGVGLVSGQGSKPRIMLSYSNDSGRTFFNERWGQIGQQGKYIRVIWRNLGSFRERIFRISISDPIKRALISAHADIEVGL